MTTQVLNQIEPWGHFDGKVVMVTGASSGIGRELCLDLARAGCRIIAAARRMDRLESLCDKINRLAHSGGSNRNLSAAATAAPLRAFAVELDVSADGPAIKAAVQRACDAFGTIDALINNAGVRGTVTSVLDLSEEEWNSTFRTNLTGLWLVSKYVCLHMLSASKGGGGSIINISSVAGLNRGQLPGSLAYSAAKAAVNTVTKVMAVELGNHKIRVNSICPGIFKSGITEGLMQKDWLPTVTERTVPLRTLGTLDPALTN